MELKIFRSTEIYQLLKTWWEGHSFPVLPLEFLSSELFAIETVKGDLAYVINVYKTNSGFCWIGFPLSNPFIPKEDKDGLFQELLKQVEEVAKEWGYAFIFTTSSVKYIDEEMEKAGFALGDQNVKHYIKHIN